MSGQGSAGNVIAALASLFIPGLGQLLQGRLLPADRGGRVHLRLGQGEPLVGQRADAHRLPMSAIVSRIAMVMLVYIILSLVRNEKIDMRCLDTAGLFLLVAIIVDFSLEALDYTHRIYQAEESIGILSQLVTSRLFFRMVIMQLAIGMFLPLLILSLVRIRNFNDDMRRLLYFVSVLLIEVGIFSMRWNVVIGGQLYSKSFRGLMAYKMELTGMETLLMPGVLLPLPFIILAVLFWLLPPRWMEKRTLAAV